MKKKKKGRHGAAEPMDSEDVEELMALSKEDFEAERLEFERESESSQSEALAKSLAKMPEVERMDALRRLRREDVILFETVEYLLKRLIRR